MTKKTPRWHQLIRLPLATAVAASVAAPVSAFQFNVGDVGASFDTTLSAGVSWRVEEQDKSLITQGNLAPKGNNPFVNTTTGGSSNNYDDGNLNFKKGDQYSRIVKGTSELLMSWENYGAFVRGRYWYDFLLKDERLALDGAGNLHPLSAEGDANASGAEFQDAYIWADYNILEIPVNIRFGRQVLSWGESTFIFNGINVINPFDVGAIHAPGAEVKDVLLPVEMLYIQSGIAENVTLEAYVQLKQRKTRIDDCGTFFSTADFVADGCGPVLLAGQLPDRDVFANGIIAPRLGDKEANDTDQFGAALRWYAAALNDTEFGLYYVQYNSRVPLISGVVAANPLGSGAETLPQYFIEYPNRTKMIGLSFSTSTESGYSIGGEYSFKQDVPVQWNAFELLVGGLGSADSKLYQREFAKAGGNAASLFGKTLPGFDLFDISQLQFTAIKFFEQVMGASRLTMVGEVGGTYVHSLPGTSEARYGRSGIYGIGDYQTFDSAGTLTSSCKGDSSKGVSAANINTSNCTDDGFTTSFSWGYRVRFGLNYLNAIAGVNLTPTLALSHDVSGYAPEPGGNFVEGRKSVGLSLKAEYLNQYTATLGYTSFFGGDYNVISDRDNMSLSVSTAF